MLIGETGSSLYLLGVCDESRRNNTVCSSNSNYYITHNKLLGIVMNEFLVVMSSINFIINVIIFMCVVCVLCKY